MDLKDPKDIELDSKFKSSGSVEDSLQIIWESLNHNFNKIRTRLHNNTNTIQKMAFQLELNGIKVEELQVRQKELEDAFNSHCDEQERTAIAREVRIKTIYKIIGGTGAVITVVLAIMQIIRMVQ